MNQTVRNFIILGIVLIALAGAMAYIFTPRDDANRNNAYVPPLANINKVAAPAQNTNTTVATCQSDTDCVTAGCSGEICKQTGDADTPDTSICVYQDWYRCLSLTNCGCIHGQCQWETNKQYTDCRGEYQ